MKKSIWVFFLLGILALFGCDDPYKAPPANAPTKSSGGSLQSVLTGKAPTKVKRWKVELTNAYQKGPKTAPVTIIEFSDFQCPFCSRGAKILYKLMKKYKGKVRIAFKHFPLSFHKQAHLAAQASLAAGKQGKFWEYHDKLFGNLSALKKGRPVLDKYAKELKLDLKKFKAALDNKTYKAQVDADMKQGTSVKVSGTPTAFVNGRQSSVNEAKLEALIKEELERTKPLLAKGLKGDKLYNALIADGQKNDVAAAKSGNTNSTTSTDDDKVYDIAVGDSPGLGKYGAHVTLIAFSDFQCPSGSSLSTSLRKLAKAYKDRIHVVFKHRPHHGMSDRVAHAAVAAQKFGSFWKYHDELITNRNKLDRNALLDMAKDVGLDRKMFETMMNSAEVKATVESDLRQAKLIKAPENTVSLYINGKKFKGGYSFANLKAAIDPILIKKGLKKEDLPEEPAMEIDTSNAPTAGAAKPLVSIVEFSDFQCPFCTRAASMLNDIKDAYKKWVQVSFKHYPLSFHKEAHLAAQASLAAHAQGKFWPYHDLLFRNQKKLYKPDLLRYARQLKLDMTKFKAALDNKTYKAQVDADMSEGTKVGVSGTPTIFLNGRTVKAYKFADMKKALDKILLKKGVKKSELPKGPPPKVIPTQGAPAKGAAKPLVTVVEFSDFQCPFCSRAAKTINDLAKVYGKWVRVVFKQYPLGFHKDAHLAAQASLAAHAQGKFWPYHDLLFQNTRQLKRPWLDKYAKQVGLDMAKFKAALDNGTYKDKVDQEMSEGGKVGVSGTPSFFVNGKAAKSPSFDALKKDIDKILLAKGVKKSELPKGPPPFVINTKGAPAKGPAKPLATIVEFSDFQCPYCSRMAKTLDEVAAAYKKWIRVVFKQYPLGFHKDAHFAAQAALAAHAQGKFWEYHDKLFQNTRRLKRPWLDKYAQEVGLDMAKFKAALDNKTYKAAVDKDMRDGGAARVRGTPSVYLNNKPIKAYKFEAFKKLLDPILLKNGVKKSELPTKPIIPIPTEVAPSKGPDNAPVTVVEFSDFQCPYCAIAGLKLLKQLQKAYGNKIRIVFKHYPLSFHKQAHLAAQASLAAHAQGKFWAYHDKLFQNYRQLRQGRSVLEKFAKEVGLDMGIFKQALDSGQYKSAVDQDMKDGGKVGVNGTPSFFVNNIAVSSPSIAAMKKAIDAALKAKAKN